MRLSHVHLAFVDYFSAVKFFETIFGWVPVQHSPIVTVFHCEGLDLALHPDWGQGDTAMTLAFSSQDCRHDFSQAVQKGAKPRTEPRPKDASLNADIFGPGKLVIEFEQLLA